MRLAACLGAAFVAAVAAAPAGATPVLLPTLLTQLTPVPPFAAPAAAAQEVEGGGGRLRFPVDSDETISVGIDARGRPFALRVRQRLVLRRTGDYSFTIGAPVEDVRAAPGSESEPGLRRGAVLWQGFSPRRKVLAADLVLRAREAGSALPLRVSVSRKHGEVRVRLVNATATRTPVFTARARPAEAAAVLDEIRRQGAVPSATGIVVNVLGKTVANEGVVAAPLRVRGEIRFRPGALRAATVEGAARRGDAIPVDVLLGDGEPLAHDVVVRGVEGEPRVRVTATPQLSERLLDPPRGDTWRAFVRGRNIDGRTLLSRAVLAQLASARARQYQTFVSNPDAYGGRTATYRFLTEQRAETAAPVPGHGGGGFPVALLAIPLALVGACALVVLWAHS